MNKIALIEPVGGHGGMDYYDYGLAMGLSENEIEVHYHTSTKTQVRQYKNVYTYLSFKNVWETPNKIARLFYLLSGYKRAFKHAKSNGIAIMHFQFFDLGMVNFLVMRLASMYKFKKVLTLHDVSSFKGKDSSYTEGYILKQFDTIIVHNQLSFDELAEKIKNKGKIAIIPHGNYLPFIKELSYLPDADSPLKLLFFGQIKKVKGLEVLLEAIALIKKQNVPVQLKIVGKVWHDSHEKYEKLIDQYGIVDCVSTHFQFIPDEQVASYFDTADLVVLPYKKIYQSGVLLLAMSYGRPVLTSDLPAFLEIVENESNGYTFKSENPDDLAKVLLNIIENRNNLPKMRECASKLLKSKYDWSAIGLLTKNAYKKII